MPKSSSFVTGWVLDAFNTDTSGEPLRIAGAEVQIGLWVGRRFEVLDTATTGNDGRYRLDVSTLVVMASGAGSTPLPKELVGRGDAGSLLARASGANQRNELRVFLHGRPLPIREGASTWKPGLEPLDYILKVEVPESGELLDDPLKEVEPPAEPWVRGVIRHSDGSPIEGLSVTAYDRGVIGESVLGTDDTDEFGVYEIAYSGTEPNLFIRIQVPSSGKNKEVGASEIRFRATSKERIDWTLEDTDLRGASEFQRIDGQLGNYFNTVDLNTVQAEDIAVAVGATGIGREQISRWIAAKILAAKMPGDQAVVRVYDGTDTPLWRGQQVLSSGATPHAHYHLNDNDGTTATDSSGFGRDAELQNMDASAWVPGHLGASALNFTGTDHHVTCGDIADFDRHDPFSFEAWVRTTSTSSMVLASRWNNARGWLLRIRPSDHALLVVLSNTENGDELRVRGTTPLNSGNWQHVVVTYDGSSQASGVKIFVDGELETLHAPLDNLTSSIHTDGSCQISGRNGGNECYQGEIDEVVIYDGELSHAEVFERFNAGNGIETFRGWTLVSDSFPHSGVHSFGTDVARHGSIARFNSGTVQPLGGYSVVGGWLTIIGWRNPEDKDIAIFGWDNVHGVRVGKKVPLSQYVDTSIVSSEQQFVIPLRDLNLVGQSVDALCFETIALQGTDVPVCFFDDIELGPLSFDRDEVLYALLRQGLPANLSWLLSRRPGDLSRALKRSAATNIVSDNIWKMADDIAAALVALALDLSADTDTPVDGSLGLLLAAGTVSLSPAQRRTVLDRWTRGTGTIEQFWSELADDEGFDAEMVADVQRTIQLGTISVNHPILIRAINQSNPTEPPTARDTGAYTYQQWRDLLDVVVDGKEVGTPPGIVGDTPGDKKNNYAKLLVKQAERAFPSPAVARRLKDDSTPGSDMRKFLDRNPEFEFGLDNVTTFVEGASAPAGGWDDEEQLKSDLRKYQRLFRIAPEEQRYDAMDAMLQAGVDSAQAASRKGKQRFIEQFSGAFGSDERAREVFNKANTEAATALAVMTMHHPALQGPKVAMIGSLPEPTSSAYDGIPDFASLFGSLDFCACDHCRSIHGPAAYYVDLLAWLKDRDGWTGSERLQDRRPDLGALELSCDNTNRVLPYVDLVNEILEIAVIKASQANPAPPVPTLPTATTATNEELLAHPEYIFTDAYEGEDGLKAAVWPLALPYHFAISQCRAYLEHLGVDRAELMETFQHPGDPSDTEIAQERLGIAPGNAAIIITPHDGPNGTDPWAYWGYAGGDVDDPTGGANPVPWFTALRYVPEFLDQSSIEYDELLDLVHTRYFSNRTAEVDPNPLGIYPCNTCDGCQLEDLFIGDATAPTAAEFGRAVAFLRLWKTLSWTFLELDKALQVPSICDWGSSGEIDGDTFEALAAVAQVEEKTSVDRVRLLAWWGTIDTWLDRPGLDDPEPCLYDQLFLDRTVLSATEIENSAFKLNGARTELDTVPADIESYTEQLQSAFGADSDDVAAAIAWVAGDPPVTVAMNLANLSQIFRLISLAQAIELSVEQTLDAMKLMAATGDDEFDPFASPAATLHFLEQLDLVRTADLTVDQLSYVLAHAPDALGRVAPEESWYREFMGPLRDDLRALNASISELEDPDGSQTREVVRETMVSDRELDFDDVMAVVDGSSEDTPTVQRDTLEEQLGHVLDIDDAYAKLIDSDPGNGHYLPPETHLAERYYYVLTSILLSVQGASMVVERLAELLELDREILEEQRNWTFAFLAPWGFTDYVQAFLDSDVLGVDSDEDPDDPWADLNAEDDVQQFGTIELLYKVSLLIHAIGLSADELRWWMTVRAANQAQQFELLDFGELVVEEEWSGANDRHAKLMAGIELFGLRDRIPGTEPTFVALLDELLVYPNTPPSPVPGGATEYDAFFTVLGERTSWDTEQLKTLAAGLGYPDPDSLFHAAALDRLIACQEMASRIGASVQDVANWRAADPPLQAAAPDQSVPDAIRLAARSRYSSGSGWSSVAQPIREVIREEQRAALVAWLVARDPLAEDATDLYGKYLIDVEMAPCFLTSRLKQGITSVQLFIQRCFLGLEGVILHAEDAEQWEWMKNYRVWEAARKVFLYPENWIEPQLRDDKTPLFEALESSLLQAEVNEENVETAVLGYLDGLLDVAQLKVCGVYHQLQDDDGGGETDILHVFAKTRGLPERTYYRQRESGAWSPWEKVGLDIVSDQIVPVVFNRRLMVFWPVFLEMAWGDPDSDETGEYWDIELHWSEYRNGKWSPKKVSTAPISTHNVIGGTRPDPREYSIETQDDGDNLVLTCVSLENSGEIAGRFEVGQFILNPCTQELQAVEINAGIVGEGAPVPADTVAHYQGFYKTTEESPNGLPGGLSLPIGKVGLDRNYVQGTTSNRELLKDLPSNVAIVVPKQFDAFVSQAPFFVQDYTRAFFVEPLNVDQIAPLWQQMQEGNLDVAAVSSLVHGDEYTTPVAQYTKVPATNIYFDDLLASVATKARSSQQMQTVHDQLTEVAMASEDSILESPYDHRFRFYAFYHPYVCRFIEEVRRHGIRGLLSPDEEGPAADLARQQLTLEYFDDTYNPWRSYVRRPYPIDDVDFEYAGPYAAYNWELFFHLPLLVATRLMDNQRYDEAMAWFHTVFDPTNRSASVLAPYKYWMIKPFQRPVEAPITDWVSFTGVDSTDPEAQAASSAFVQQVEAWRDDPFNPHLIARLRTSAYQRTVVMKYIDNLIAWGDDLFRQDTMESVAEATQLYLLAFEILGERPVELAPRSEPEVQSFDSIEADLDVFSNALIETENLLFEVAKPRSRQTSTPMPYPGPTAFFCVPPNDQLMGYWDTVEDRLFKIRHCMNIEGVVRQLPLFQPPIDPAMLVRAAAAGVDIGSVLSGMNMALPHYRFRVMLQKAKEFNGTVRALGGALLSALEKKDAEALALLRSTHEIELLKAIAAVREDQVEEAKEALAGLEQAKAITQQRWDYYTTLLLGDDPTELDGLIDAERKEEKHTEEALRFQVAAESVHAVGSFLSVIPQLAVPPGTEFGGLHLANLLRGIGQGLSTVSSIERGAAARNAQRAMRARRELEWNQQKELADLELVQIDRQIEGAKLRVAIAEQELANHRLQMQQAQTVNDWMESKYTNEELYSWMITQVSTLYYQSYQLAFDMAKRAQACFQHELAKPSATYVQYGHWDSLKKGLLAGERLQYDLERMDTAYLDSNRREHEITKMLSLDLLDPLALIRLREEGVCFFHLPEAVFDLDIPGHYMRRLRSVSLTIPCIAGPHTPIHAKLTLLGSSIRIDASTSDPYPRDGGPYGGNPATEDARFRDELGTIESIVTSQAQDDTGLFTFDFRDDRYLPFEGRGAISTWRLKLTSALPQFDYRSIRDAVITLRYTARDGGDPLENAARTSIFDDSNLGVSTLNEMKTGIDTEDGSDWQVQLAAATPGTRRAIFSASDFPDEWFQFINVDQPNHQLVLDLEESNFLNAHVESGPGDVSGIELTQIEVFVVFEDGWTEIDLGLDYEAGTDSKTLAVNGYGLAHATYNPLPGDMTIPRTLTFSADSLLGGNTLTDIQVVIHYSVANG